MTTDQIIKMLQDKVVKNEEETKLASYYGNCNEKDSLNAQRALLNQLIKEIKGE